MVAVAGLLGVGVPAWRAAVGPADAGPDQVAPAVAALEPWRPELARLGVRIPLALEADPRRSTTASARLLITSYALAPAVVVPVVLPACLPAGRGDCGLADAPCLLLCEGAVGQAMGLAIRLGLTRVASSGPCVLLQRPAP